MSESGQLIKKLREDRFLKSRDVERQSRAIADRKGNDDYYIGHATLSDVENGTIPGIYKIECLAIIFKIPLTQMLRVFGIDSRDTEQPAQTVPTRETALEPVDLTEADASFRLNFDNRFNPRETDLLKGKPEEWGIAPVALLRRLQPQRFTYALVGLDDDSMADIIPPGSLIEVDRSQATIQPSSWRTLRERPIYLLWHDDGYSSVWCQQERHEILLIPHPASNRPVRRLTIREATIIGRIVHAWCSLQLPPVQEC
jgi:hypothetical protein